MSDILPLHLVRIPLRVELLVPVARRRGIPLRNLDDGYLVHSILREIWQEHAPAPFKLEAHERLLCAWGYSQMSSYELIEHANGIGKSEMVTAIDRLTSISSRVVPILDSGRRVRFTVRMCPVVRLNSSNSNYSKGAEIDAYLHQIGNDDKKISREEVYLNWFRSRYSSPDKTGCEISRIGISAIQRKRFIRRTQGNNRKAIVIERPDVEFTGEFLVQDGNTLYEMLRKGIGRHRAFGFGAVILLPLTSRD